MGLQCAGIGQRSHRSSGLFICLFVCLLPIGRQVLETFLESEFSSENIRFWMAIQDLKFAPNSQVEAKAEHIHSQFFASGAPCQVSCTAPSNCSSPSGER
jgi:hypothetical protein